MARRKHPLTHIDETGRARMVDVSEKTVSARGATAEAFVRMPPDVAKAVGAGDMSKGDVLSVARLAGIMGAKRTHELIPLCHPLALTDIEVEAAVEPDGVLITASVKTRDRTGVEMEALTAVSVAALTVYDMCKAADKGITIENVRLKSKSGGKSGRWKADGRRAT